MWQQFHFLYQEVYDLLDSVNCKGKEILKQLLPDSDNIADMRRIITFRYYDNEHLNLSNQRQRFMQEINEALFIISEEISNHYKF